MSIGRVFDNGGFVGIAKGFIELGDGVLPGEAEYTSPGTYSWTCPTGVTSVCVVCVGGGGGGVQGGYFSSGGGGGGLGWKNDITVIPGQSYTVVVGAGGARDTNTGVQASGTNSTSGGASYFISSSTVAGFGGGAGLYGEDNSPGGGYVGDGGGGGGRGGGGTVVDSGGGGGAGGYAGAGGNGGVYITNPTAGSGGGGGGGGQGQSGDTAGGGGGVGIYGQGTSGAAGSVGTINGGGGGGGSGGTAGNSGGTSTASGGAKGGLYGGGGGGADNTANLNGAGGGGAVRIIWGENRAFPATNTADGAGDPIQSPAYVSGIWSLESVYESVVSYGSIGNGLYPYNPTLVNASMTTSTTFNVTVNNGDILLFYIRNTTQTAPALPSGTTNINSINDTVNSRSMRIGYIIGDGTQKTISWAGSHLTYFTISGAANVIGQNVFNVQSGALSTQTIPALNGLSTNKSLVLGFNQYPFPSYNITSATSPYSYLNDGDVNYLYYYKPYGTTSASSGNFTYTTVPVATNFFVEII